MHAFQTKQKKLDHGNHHDPINTSKRAKQYDSILSSKIKMNKNSTSLQYSLGIQVHFRCTMAGPDSSYSSFLIHISSKVDSEDKMEPPIQTEYFLSGGAMILIVIESGAIALIPFCTLSGIPLYIVVPPLITTLLYSSFRISTSHFMIDLKVSSSMPFDSNPNKCGWNMASGARNLSAPMVIISPSGSS